MVAHLTNNVKTGDSSSCPAEPATRVANFPYFQVIGTQGRLMTMSPLYPCGEPCSTGTHNKTGKS